MSENLNKHLIALTGEYLVAGMMSLKGWVASLTLKNYPSVDIFGLNPDTQKTVNIQVKTTRNQSSYSIGVTHETINKIKDKVKCPYVFVHIDKGDNIRYFILKAEDLVKQVLKSNNDYLAKPRDKAVKQSNPVAIPLSYLKDFEDKWENIWE